MKRALIALTAYCCASFCTAQIIPGDRIPIDGDEKGLLYALQAATPGIPKTEALLELSAYYLYLDGEKKEDLEKANRYALQARELAAQIHYTTGYTESLILTGTVIHEKGNDSLAHLVLDTAIAIIEKAKLQARLEHKARDEARFYRQIISATITKGNYEKAIDQLVELLKFYDTHKFRNKHYNLQRLSLMWMLLGDRNKSLHYILEAVRSMEATGDFASAASIYNDLGFLYREIGQFQKGIEYYQLAFDLYKKKASSTMYELAYGIAEAHTKLGQTGQAIAFLKKVAAEHPPGKDDDKATIAFAFAIAYRVAKQYALAEEQYKIHAALRKGQPLQAAMAARNLGQLYIEWGKYADAKPYLEQSLRSGFFVGKSLAHLHFLLYKADSAAGDYLSAINHIMINKSLDDAEYREAKIRENRELQIKYETERKDHAIVLHEKSIQLLKANALLLQDNLEQTRLRFLYDSLAKDKSLQQLSYEAARKDKDLLMKQQSIQSLEKQDLLKQDSLRQANLIKKMTIAGIILLLIILSLLYNQYRVKLSNSKELSRKNQSLERLVDEKEWLLKEVHHRVKNNLHTIMSLLETQSVFLKDDALAAVQNSQHRVYAMSLIHQRLYQKENSTIVDMGVYFPELISYLKESYDTRQRITIAADIEHIRLDISQAIPAGLILNEAVTNAIKYAFPHNQQGQISIGFIQHENGKIIMSISDNGIGLPPDWKEIQKKSLGLKLMKGLSDDLKADFTISSDKGTSLVIVFDKELYERNKEHHERQHSGETVL